MVGYGAMIGLNGICQRKSADFLTSTTVMEEYTMKIRKQYPVQSNDTLFGN